jgi:D-alanyl-D-alanine carboxypeptidase
MKHSRYNRVAAMALILLLVLTGGGSAFCASLSSARAGSATGEALIALGSGVAASTDTKEIPKINAILPGGPAISGKAGIVMEVHSGAILFAKNATESYMPMSLTKLMTALLVLEDGSMTDTVRCSYTAINGIGSKVTRVGLVADERVSVLDMLYASLVASADEATYALGEHVGGSSRNSSR